MAEPGPPGAATSETVVVRRRRFPPEDIGPWLLALLFAVAAVAAVIWALSERNEGTRTNRVPALVGLPRSRATADLRARGFAAKVNLVTSPKPAGIVVDQAPEAHAALSRGSFVYVAVSRGAATISVPKVVGLKRPAAIRLLDSVHLVAQSTIVASSKPAKVVLTQTPQTGAKVARGAVVTLTVSSGPRLVSVPALQGVKRARAISELTVAGLVPEIVMVASGQPAGTVVAQSPASGTKVKPASKVRLNVSEATSTATTSVPSTGATATVTVTVTSTTTRTRTVTTTTTTP